MPWSAALLATCLVLAVAWRRESGLRRRLAGARADSAAMMRSAHLAAHELRDAALRLHGLAPGRVAGGSQDGRARDLARLAARCRRIGDDLAALGPPRRPSLMPEPLDLCACAREASSALAATIAPGRRHLRLELASAGTSVLADRRACREVLGRVLGEAALHTGEDDWIAVTVAPDPAGGVLLGVADEGAGLAAPAHATADQADSRGIGASLALARTLMAAHGGTLRVEASLGAGTRVWLWFPQHKSTMRLAAAAGSPGATPTLSSS